MYIYACFVPETLQALYRRNPKRDCASAAVKGNDENAKGRKGTETDQIVGLHSLWGDAILFQLS